MLEEDYCKIYFQKHHTVENSMHIPNNLHKNTAMGINRTHIIQMYPIFSCLLLPEQTLMKVVCLNGRILFLVVDATTPFY